MKTFNKEIASVFIDIDDTITKDFGITSIDNSIKAINKLSKHTNIYIWSQGGVPYSIEIVKKFELEDCICGIIPKPDIIIDDLTFKEWGNEVLPIWENISNIADTLIGDWVEDSGFLKSIKNK